MDTAINKQEEQQYISTIKVEGLFGKFDHTIKLKEGGLTILYGENGVGKTTLFKLIYHGLRYCGVKGGDFFEQVNLMLIPFDKVIILDQKETKVYSINKIESPGQSSLESKYRKLFRESISSKEKETEQHKLENEYFHFVRSRLPHGVEKNYTDKGNLIKNNHTDGIVARRDFINKYKYVPHELSLTKGLVNNYLYTDPYFIPSTRTQETRINLIAKDFLKTIAYYEEEFEDRILKLNSSLNSRITNGEVSTEFEEEKLKEKLKELRKRVKELQQVGLLYKQETPITTLSDKLTEVAKAMVAINTNEYLEALEIFNNIYKKLHLFLDIINNRRFNYKKIAINKVEGLTVRDDEGNLFPLSNLSSGEQHELILIYELLFGHKSTQKKIFLIDEPEISLHVLWQMDFIKDMQEIIKLTGVQIIAATHSPAIINGNWDLTVQLKHPEQKSDTEGAEKEGGNE